MQRRLVKNLFRVCTTPEKLLFLVYRQVISGKKIFENVRSKGNVTSLSINSRQAPKFDTESSIHGYPEPAVSIQELNVRGHVTFDHPLIAGKVLNADFDRLNSSGVRLTVDEFPLVNSTITFAGNLSVIILDLSSFFFK